MLHSYQELWVTELTTKWVLFGRCSTGKIPWEMAWNALMTCFSRKIDIPMAFLQKSKWKKRRKKKPSLKSRIPKFPIILAMDFGWYLIVSDIYLQSRRFSKLWVILQAYRLKCMDSIPQSPDALKKVIWIIVRGAVQLSSFRLDSKHTGFVVPKCACCYDWNPIINVI